MFEEIEEAVPVQWKGLFRVIILPISWIPPLQSYLLDLAWYADLGAIAFFKRIFLVFPVISIIVGFWCSMLAVYTLAFRSNRVQFISSFLVCWWDVVRCAWLFWAGMGKFLWLLFGSIWGLLRLGVGVVLELIREIFELPFVLTGTLTRNLRQPGVPWLAFLMTIAWALLEAMIFTYILTPTFSEIISDLVGTESHRFLSPVLFVMLFLMIAGSFACMHVLIEAISNKDIKGIVQMAVVEFFVMFVEVMFLYRELVDALTPWIAQQTGFKMGIVPVLILASSGWIGIRGMVWLLFARFGTPTLLAIMARQRLTGDESSSMPKAQVEEHWDLVMGKIKREQGWFQEKGDALLSAAVLPVFQVIASGLNFCFVLFMGRSIFNLPFESLADIKDTKALLEIRRPARNSN